MGTERFREDISEALKRCFRDNPGQKPTILKVNFRDAMAWHTHEGSKLPIGDFVEKDVKAYASSIPFQKSTVQCLIGLLNVNDDSPTHFE